MEFIELKSDLLTTDNTRVFHEAPKEQLFNAPHTFEVTNAHTGEEIQTIHFQEGPIKECGVNGVANEDLIGMVICRLEHFQNSPFHCTENLMAIDSLKETLMWLRARTNIRKARGVAGTNQI